MSRIFLTGDTHGGKELWKLNSENFPIGRELTKDDYVIVLGDFGLIWNNDKEDLYWRKWLNEKPWTTLFVDGNHENHILLNQYVVENWNNGKIHKIESSIYHLMRGQVFIINSMKFMTMGGAHSIDVMFRKKNISWWEEELPSYSEYKELLNNLKKHNYNVDYVLTHTCPIDVFAFVVNNHKEMGIKNLERFFYALKRRLVFKKWYFGHFHMDKIVDDKHRCMFSDVIEIP